MKKWLYLILCLTLMVSVVACGGGEEAPVEGDAPEASGETITIKIGTVVSENNPAAETLELFKTRLAEETDGRMEVIIYYSGQIGGEPEMLKQAVAGDIQMFVTNPVLTSSTITPLAAMERMFIFNDWDHAMRFLDSEAGDYLLDAYNMVELQGLTFMPIGFRQYTNSKHPIATIEDFSGIKMRGYSETQIAAWESVGANLSSVAWNELFTALQTNLIDAQEAAITGVVDAKLYEVQPYITLTDHQLSTDVLAASQTFLDSLSEEDRTLIETVAKEVGEYHRGIAVEAVEEMIVQVEEYGCEVTAMTAEAKGEMREAIGVVVDPVIVGVAGQEAYDIVDDAVEATREG